MKRRWLIRAAVLLFLGATVNIATAWWIAAAAAFPARLYMKAHDGLRWPIGPPGSFPTAPGYLATATGFGIERCETEAHRCPAAFIAKQRRHFERELAKIEARYATPFVRDAMGEDLNKHLRDLDHVLQGEHCNYRIVAVRTGWPCRCLAGFRWYEDDWPGTSLRRQGVQSGLEIDANPIATPGQPAEKRILPLLCQPGGFAINTLFYAVIIWVVFGAPAAIRRYRRVDQGQCPACGYPVGASDVCTECGRVIRNRQS